MSINKHTIPTRVYDLFCENPGVSFSRRQIANRIKCSKCPALVIAVEGLVNAGVVLKSVNADSFMSYYVYTMDEETAASAQMFPENNLRESRGWQE